MKQTTLNLNLNLKKTLKREFLEQMEQMEQVVPLAALVELIAPYYPPTFSWPTARWTP